MRTDTVMVRTVLLAAALLGAAGPALSAQEPATEPVRREVEAARQEARAAAAHEMEEARAEVAHELAGTRVEVAEARREVGRATAQARGTGVSVLTGDHVVGPGEVVQGDMVVVEGDLTVRGEIRGNAVVTGGDLRLEEGGKVLGDAVVTGGQVLNRGGRVLGEMLTLAGEGAAVIPTAPRAPKPPPQVVRLSRSSWFDDIGQGIAGIFSTLAFGMVLAGIGAGIVFYGIPYLRAVSDTVRKQTGRSAAVGLAASFLVIPAFVLLIVALAISIIGIPVLLVAVPLYPLAVVAALGFGLLAVAHVIGEYTAEQRGSFDFNYRNAYAYVFFGIGLLLAPLLAGHVIGMVGFIGWVGTLLKVLGALILLAAATLGMGAVILSRAGTRPPVARDFDPVLDGDPLFDVDADARRPNA